MKLYEIAEKYRQIDALLDENGGEVTDGIAAALDSLEGELAEKVDAIGGLVREATASVTAYEFEIERLREHRDTADSKARRLRDYLLNHLKAIGVEKAKGKLFSARTAKAGRPSISCPAGSYLPPDLARTRIEVDGTKAYEAYRAGKLPGNFVVAFTEYLDLR